MSKGIPLEWGFQLHGKRVYFDTNIFITTEKSLQFLKSLC